METKFTSQNGRWGVVIIADNNIPHYKSIIRNSIAKIIGNIEGHDVVKIEPQAGCHVVIYPEYGCRIVSGGEYVIDNMGLQNFGSAISVINITSDNAVLLEGSYKERRNKSIGVLDGNFKELSFEEKIKILQPSN